MDFCTCRKEQQEPLVLAMASVPIEPWEEPYDPKTAIRQGTIFPGLNKPFYVTDDRTGGKTHG